MQVWHGSLAAGASAADPGDEPQWSIPRSKPSWGGGRGGLPAHSVNGHDVADPSDRRDAARRAAREEPIGRDDTVVDNPPELKAGLGQK